MSLPIVPSTSTTPSRAAPRPLSRPRARPNIRAYCLTAPPGLKFLRDFGGAWSKLATDAFLSQQSDTMTVRRWNGRLFIQFSRRIFRGRHFYPNVSSVYVLRDIIPLRRMPQAGWATSAGGGYYYLKSGDAGNSWAEAIIVQVQCNEQYYFHEINMLMQLKAFGQSRRPAACALFMAKRRLYYQPQPRAGRRNPGPWFLHCRTFSNSQRLLRAPGYNPTLRHRFFGNGACSDRLVERRNLTACTFVGT